jgi:hypothetical protein
LRCKHNKEIGIHREMIPRDDGAETPADSWGDEER